MSDKKKKLKPKDIQVLRAWAGNGMSQKKTSQAMPIPSSTLIYRLSSIRQRTGLNPRNFFDLTRLLMMIQEQENEQTDGT